MSADAVAFMSEVKSEAVHKFLNHFSLGQLKRETMQRAFCELEHVKELQKSKTLPSLNSMKCSTFFVFQGGIHLICHF